ncbi:MAG: hypothetical protein DI628_03060 [Blastochloris viridis]|uniref:Uncharacterized protein n=1 Tax=Blastochloris viridis TaxID=1079 RepID=A0A6N4R528_BLAVI|nr:MAG: hypothetical protein DI628_03060 [Blastochloris viridis]
MKFGFGSKAGTLNTGKLEEIKKRLAALQGGGQTEASDKVGGGETIADDGHIPADRQTRIAEDEALVRAVLALVGMDYDQLISMDGESVYAQVTRANPEILQQVLNAERPVLAALQVAMGYKLVAEFVGKYGSTPEDIKAAMRAEFEAEMVEKEGGKRVEGPVFSGRRAAAKVPATDRKGELADVFGK